MRNTTHTLPSAADEAAIHSIVADIEQGFNGNDPQPLVRHLASDALIVNPLGTVMRGPEEVEFSVRALLAGPLRNTTAHYRLTDVTLLAPGVAVAHKSAWSSRQAADAGEPPEMNALYVFVKRQGT
ncbi:SgcJ/EcaC family oxidoreductase [uncultured Agrococcus sp.]|uniref:SgcJ/EcaC family oxidoreductase n=1 Tax=uncultured Agrococcus sp. TaxID=382258 RepID=UPI0025E86C78|nr:SgcJ/EcaC family oxidoreductase [uncultured Agrococcus sp.]